MKRNWKLSLEAAAVAALLAGTNGVAAAQSPPPGQGSQSQPPAQQSDKAKAPGVTPLTLDAPAPANAEEDAAFKAFQTINPNDSAKKIETGETFLQKYSESRYKAPVLGALTYAYLQSGNMQKMQEAGEKEIALAPNDVSTLALMGQALARSWKSSAPDAMQVLAKAEQYSKQAIEITPAMPELEQAIKVDPSPDPVNYYLLGMANKATSHFDDAIAAFNKCTALPGPMQGTCKAQAEDAKKKSATEL